MRIIAFRVLKEFWEKPGRSDSEVPLRALYHEVKGSEWNNPNELKRQYRNVSVIGEGRVVFNIKGNSYRLVVAIDYDYKIVYIRFIGTHQEYEKINAKTV